MEKPLNFVPDFTQQIQLVIFLSFFLSFFFFFLPLFSLFLANFGDILIKCKIIEWLPTIFFYIIWCFENKIKKFYFIKQSTSRTFKYQALISHNLGKINCFRPSLHDPIGYKHTYIFLVS